MATNSRFPYEERKEPQLVPNTDRLKPKPPGSSLPGVVIGIVVALVMLGVAVYLLPRMPKNAPAPTGAQVPVQPVPGELQLQGVQVVAGPTDKDFYLDGNITNTGSHLVTGIVADVKLRNSLDQVIKDVQLPAQGWAMHEQGLVSDPFTRDPIKPNDTRPFRIALNNVPGSWNHNIPDLQIVTVTATRK